MVEHSYRLCTGLYMKKFIYYRRTSSNPTLTNELSWRNFTKFPYLLTKPLDTSIFAARLF